MKRVLSNSVWLTAAHLSGFVIPLLELPILTRALGPEVYGAVLFALSLALAFSLVVEYGFNLSASREVAVSVGDPERIAQIVGNVFLAKLIIALLVVSLSFLAMLVLGVLARAKLGEAWVINFNHHRPKPRILKYHSPIFPTHYSF